VNRDHGNKVRVDQLLVERGLATTRAKAQALVLAGNVFIGTERIDKAGSLVRSEAEIRVRGTPPPFVSRGGVKLAGALDELGLDVSGLTCLDIGASTGGFTDCLLQRGAEKVVAVDVGYGQLAYKLRSDPRVIVLERTNARLLTMDQIGFAVDLTVVDASFIGLAKLAEAVVRCTRPGGQLLALVKPQFEAGKKEAARGKGVIRDPVVRSAAIHAAEAGLAAAGLESLSRVDCVLPGPKGNREAFILARRN
jgi:23S rRNA (cytidine1920-2'-O)/16S rRNA (cytidine1409-2'-O)-methyltransferase